MIWWTLILFVVSFVLTALLAPKPDIENARPDSLDPEAFPRATENAPIPLVLGKVRMNAPNTIWYGDYKTVPIVKTIKISPFKKVKQIVGYNYYLGLDLALAMGPGTVMTKIFMDDQELWSGTTSLTAPTTISIFKPSFFGGPEQGGGWVSTGTYYPGALNLTGNPIDSYLEAKIGVGKVPGYLGTAHIVFNQALIGESSQLRKTAFVLENYTNSLGLSNNGKIGEDINPAEAIYQIMTDTWRGMGISVSDIDVVNLRAIGEVLYTEGNGCSVIVTAESNGKNLIQEILRQIDSIAYQDPSSGKIVFRLVRDDYTIESLPVYDELDVIKVVNFGRSGWDEVIGQVKITFPQRDRESDAVAISQDMATVAMIGRLRSSTLSMPFVYDRDLANRIASRERSQVSVPLFRITLEMNRNAHTLRPGDVFKLDWPEYSFSGLVLRVQEFDLGSLLDGKIVVKCLQDRFALAATVFASPPVSSWVVPVLTTTTITNYALIEMPKFFVERLTYPNPDGRVNVIPFVGKPGPTSTDFNMLAGNVTGELFTEEPQAVYRGFGTLSIAYSKLAGLSDGIDAVTGLAITGSNRSVFTANPAVSDLRAGIFGLLWVNGEWMAYRTSVDDGFGNWGLYTIYRGLMGTRPLDHAVGTKVFEFSSDFTGTGDLDGVLESGTVYYKLIDHAGNRLQDPSEFTQQSLVVNQFEANRPMRPGNVRLGGSRTGLAVNDFLNRTLDWVARSRNPLQIAFETDSSVAPDLAETYDVDVMVGGFRNATLSATSVTSPYSIPFSTTNITEPNCEIRVYSRRTGGDMRSSRTYAWIPFSMDQP